MKSGTGKTQAWVSLSLTSGTLVSGATTTVTVSINSTANSLTPATYNDTVTCANTTNGNGTQTRPVSFTVMPPISIYAKITASAGPNGSISPSGAVTVPRGGDQKFTITPKAGYRYRVADVLVDGKSVGAKTSYTFHDVGANHTISASFTLDVFTNTATAGPNGSIFPSGTLTVNRGDNATFTIKTGCGHSIRRVVVDGGNKGAITTYTFKNVRADHTINAYFK